MASASSSSRITSSFRVQVLGPFTLERDGALLDTSKWQRRVRNLFTLLAIASGHRRSRDAVIDLLWPEATPEAGAGNLRLVAHRLRLALGGGDPSPILLEHGWVALNPAHGWEVDLERFEALVRAVRDDIPALEKAVDLYHGEPLHEEPYEDWAMTVRERVRREWREVCLRLADLYRSRGSLRDAAQWLERVLESDPLDEEVLQDLLEVMSELGRRTEALRRYRQFEQRLSEEMDVPPEPQTLALVMKLEEQLRQAALRTPQDAAERARGAVVVVPAYPLLVMGSLFGREVEIEQIVSAFPGASGQTPRLFLLGAEAGMGKTRMLAEVALRAHQAGILVLAGGCYEEEERLPYGPIHDSLLDYIRAQPESVLRAQLEGLLGELARVVPELRTRVPEVEAPGMGDIESQRLRLFSTVAQVLERISRDTPLILLLDDLHWADDATLQLLHYLLRQPPLGRLLMVGAYRQEEVTRDSTLERLAIEVGRTERVVPVSLAPLHQAELRTLLGERLEGRCAGSLARAIHELSGGNPFFAVQIVRLLQQEGRLEQGEEGWQLAQEATASFQNRTPLPGEVRETVARRLRYLQPAEREALTLGAVLGREFAFSALEEMWEGEEPALFQALDAARDTHLVTETETGYVFRHPLLREVVYYRVPIQRRRRLHQRAGLALERLYGPPGSEPWVQHAAELAHHFVQARDPERALPHSLLAADRAEAVYAHGEAERHYRTALDLARQRGNAAAEREALEKLGGVLRTMGRYDEALAMLEHAAEAYGRVQDLEGQRRAVAGIGQAHLWRGTLEEGVTRLEGALSSLARGTASSGLAAIYLALAHLFFSTGRYREQLVSAEQASELARTVGEDGQLVEAELVRAYALPLMGRRAEFVGVMEQVVRLAEEIDDLPTLARALCALSPRYAERGEVDRARRSLERALEIAERLGDRTRVAFVTNTCGLNAFWSGEWNRSMEYFERALTIYRELGAVSDTMIPLFGLGALHVCRGEWETGSQRLEEHIAIARRTGDLRWFHAAEMLLAERDLLEGHAEAASSRLEQLLALPELSEIGAISVLPTLAWTYLERGNDVRADELLAKSIEQATDQDARRTLAEALWVQGMVRTHQRRWEDAKSSFENALSLVPHMPYARARILYAYGLMYAQQGNGEIDLSAQAPGNDRRDLNSRMRYVQEARERFEQALAIFRRLGAQPFVRRTEQALAQLQR